MTHEVESAYDDESIEEAAQRMSERQIQRLLVMARDGKLVGIVSLGDLARARTSPAAARALEEIKGPTKVSAAGANGAHLER
jgi:CBS-domain-containing membrane protein